MTAFPKPQREQRARKPLKRSGPIKRKSARRIAKQTAEERAFMDWLHKQECCAKGLVIVPGVNPPYTTMHWCFAGQYEGQEPVQAAHFRDHTGTGRKESDLTCIPLCRTIHDDYDGRTQELFKGWSLEARKDWHRLRQQETQDRWKAARR